MKDTNFKVGDAVVLTAIGSQAMLIVEIDEKSNSVVCIWHNNNGEPKSAKYPIDLIEHSTDETEYDNI